MASLTVKHVFDDDEEDERVSGTDDLEKLELELEQLGVEKPPLVAEKKPATQTKGASKLKGLDPTDLYSEADGSTMERLKNFIHTESSSEIKEACLNFLSGKTTHTLGDLLLVQYVANNKSILVRQESAGNEEGGECTVDVSEVGGP